MFKLFSSKLLVLFITFSVLPDYTRSAFSQTADLGADSSLVEELKSLAQSDANSNIDRRTQFVIELYKSNSAGLTELDIRRVYDDTFSLQSQQNEQQRNMRRLGVGALALVGLGVATFIVAKRSILKVKTVKAQVPWVGEVEFETVENARNAAWKLYVEMKTRIATQQLGDDHGLLREALNSLYALFGITREILKEAGPDVGALPKKSVGDIAITFLNDGLRPFTAKWHPKLQVWETTRPAGRSAKEHEQNWDMETQMRVELKQLMQELTQFTNSLAEIAGAPLLNSPVPETQD
ncbi:MAG: hypothetical protein QNJ46_01125 [Leptolyngbyaceae cyanobacterium MO_188.B28]|nr:hypothetical protein [Leptolyngbyaceae cyanobacterium MO_188.B28]